MSPDREHSLPPHIKTWPAFTWTCEQCGSGVIGDSDLEGAKAHVCMDDEPIHDWGNEYE